MAKTVLILHHVSELGGGTKSLFDISLMLRDDYHVIVCAPKGSKEFVGFAAECGVELYEVRTPIPSFNLYSGGPSMASRYFWDCLFRFRKGAQLAEELMSLQPDAVIFNTSVTALIAKYLPDRVKKLCIVRETFVKSPLNRIIRSSFENRFDGIAYIAQHEMDYINVKGPLQTVIPDCLEPKAFTVRERDAVRQEYHVPLNCFCILFMGGLNRIKGLDVVLKAVDLLSDHFKLMVAGSIDRRFFSWKYLFTHPHHILLNRFFLQVRSKLDRLTEQGKVIQTGYVSDISPFMTMCDTVVFPSTAAHQPRPCIEAGNYQRSCVLSDYRATAEYFRNGYNALTFPPGNANALAEKLMYLNDHADVNDQLALNNRKMSVEKHDFAQTQKKLMLFIKNVFENNEAVTNGKV